MKSIRRNLLTPARLTLSTFAVMIALVASPLWAGGSGPPGIPNFHQVDEHVYRGAQPPAASWKGLAGMGVRVVLDLRYEGEAKEHWVGLERQAVESAGMRYVSVPMDGWSAPTPEQMSRILAVLDSGEPVFVHCRGGRDRTGTAIACYRMVHDHWTNSRALAEAASYGMNPLEKAMQAYILGFHAPAPPLRAAAPLPSGF
ncbi:MAG TPA: tyrosine-protein phosphatase [Bryobacteraceae bacterium]|nr:tyrosine-protein phosphatase [Bryobacteraceae bacterium]